MDRLDLQSSEINEQKTTSRSEKTRKTPSILSAQRAISTEWEGTSLAHPKIPVRETKASSGRKRPVVVTEKSTIVRPEVKVRSSPAPIGPNDVEISVIPQPTSSVKNIEVPLEKPVETAAETRKKLEQAFLEAEKKAIAARALEGPRPVKAIPEEKIDPATLKIKRLEETIRELKNQIQALDSSNHTRSIQNQEWVETLTRELWFLEREKTNAEEQCDFAKFDIRMLESQISDLQTILHQKEAQLTIHKEQARETQKEIEVLQEQVIKLFVGNIQTAAMEEVTSEVSLAEIKRNQEEIAELKRALVELNEAHQKELQALHEQKLSLELEIEKTKNTLDSARESIEILKEKITQTMDAHAALVTEKEQKIIQLEESTNLLRQELGQFIKDTKEAESFNATILSEKVQQLQEAKERADILKEEIKALKLEIDQKEIRLQSSEDSEELYQQLINRLGDEQKTLHSTIGQKQELIRQKNEEITALTKALQSQESVITVLKRSHLESEELKASLKQEIEQKTAALNARIAELSDTQKSHERAISENQAQLSAKELEISNLQEELKFANDQLSAAANKEEADGKTIEALREENQNSLRQAKTHIAEVQSLRDSLNALRRQQQSLQTEQAQTVREKEAFQRQVEELNVEKAQILAKEKEEYAAYDAYINETGQEVKAKIAALNKEKEDLTLQIEREQAKVREIKEAIGENPIQRVQFLESTNLSLQREVAAKNAALAVLRQEKDTAVTGRLEAELYLEERDQQAQQSREMLIRQFAQEKAEFVEVRERLEAEVQSQTVSLEQAAQYGQQLVDENRQMREALDQKTNEIWKMQQMLRIEREQMALEIGRLREEARRVPQTVVVQDETKIRALQQELVETRRALEEEKAKNEWVMVEDRSAKSQPAATSSGGFFGLTSLVSSVWGSSSVAEAASVQPTSTPPAAWMEAVKEAHQPQQQRAQRMSASAAAKREAAEVPIDGDAHIAYLTTVQEAIRGVRANCNRLSFLDHAEKMRYTFVEVRNRNEEVIGYAQLDAQANVVWTNSIDAALAGLSAPKVAQMKNLFQNPMSQGMKEDYFEIRPFSDDGSAYRAHFKK